MIEAIYYQTTYCIIVAILTIIVVYFYDVYGINISKKNVKFNDGAWALLLTLFMILFIGFRPISSVFVDMPGYAYGMLDGRFERIETTWDNNFIFYPMMAFLSSHGASPQTPIVILATINYGITYIAMRKFFPKDTTLAMLVYCIALSTFAGATNGLKQGCAAAILLAALAYRENLLAFIFFLFLSFGFHHAMQLPIAAAIVCIFYKKTNTYYFFWFVCLIISLFHVTYFQTLFAGVTDEQGADYLFVEAGSWESSFKGRVGFRYDFVIYSVMPMLIGRFIILKKKIETERYSYLINVYTLTNAIWLLCMYANYTNRIASLSWGIYPVIIIYPFLKERINRRQGHSLISIVLIHLSFTLFMFLIYKGV